MWAKPFVSLVPRFPYQQIIENVMTDSADQCQQCGMWLMQNRGEILLQYIIRDYKYIHKSSYRSNVNTLVRCYFGSDKLLRHINRQSAWISKDWLGKWWLSNRVPHANPILHHFCFSQTSKEMSFAAWNLQHHISTDELWNFKQIDTSHGSTPATSWKERGEYQRVGDTPQRAREERLLRDRLSGQSIQYVSIVF